MYSEIPVIGYEWKDGEGEHAILFIPLVGYVIGALSVCAWLVLSSADAPAFVTAAAPLIIAVLITGGFHVDGFMDTADALASYQTRERKLEILKDPHVGSFAVIRLFVTGLIMLCALSVCTQGSWRELTVTGGVFVISRALAAFTSLILKKAKDDGMLVMETKVRGPAAYAVIAVQMAVAAAVMIYASPVHACTAAAAFALFTPIYAHKMKEQFGGVTGDTAGYFVTASEAVSLSALAAYMLISGTVK